MDMIRSLETLLADMEKMLDTMDQHSRDMADVKQRLGALCAAGEVIDGKLAKVEADVHEVAERLGCYSA